MSTRIYAPSTSTGSCDGVRRSRGSCSRS